MIQWENSYSEEFKESVVKLMMQPNAAVVS